MAQVINTNIASLNAQRNLNSSQAGTNQALERLSSGLRINSAKDDAAGLAISTRFTSQIKGLNVAVRNANDGISLAETAEASMGSMTDSLQRLRELAVQSANGSYSDTDRQLLNEEAQALIAEVGRVADTANFNGVKLLDGSYNSSFQIGANAGETIDVSIGKLSADALGVSAQDGISSTATSEALGAGDLIINGVSVGATRASDDSASTVDANESAIAKAAAINRVSDESGVTAVVDTNIAAGTTMGATAASSGSVTINGTTINIDTSADNATSRAAVVAAINAESDLTGVTAVDTGDDALGVTLEAADGRNIAISFTTVTAEETGLAGVGTYTGGVTLVAQPGVDSIEIGGSDVANAGLTAGTYAAGESVVGSEVVTTATATAPADLDSGDMVINGISIAAAKASDDTASYTGATSSTKESSAIAIAAAINKSSDATGVTAEVNANVVEGTTTSAPGASDGVAADLYINGVELNLTVQGTAEENRAYVVSQINSVSGQTGVVAEDNGQGVTLTAADGRNIVMAMDVDPTNTDAANPATAAMFGLDASAVNVADLDGDAAASNTSAVTTYSTVTLKSGGQFTVSAGENGNTALEALGFEAGTFGGAETGQRLTEVDLSTQKGATDALATIDNALSSITASRSELGAVQNRFTATIENLSATSEKFAAANSRIQDADFAAEAANLARSQALQQAGVSMLAQANAQSQQVLQLLG